jgi:hypothetical protein
MAAQIINNRRNRAPSRGYKHWYETCELVLYISIEGDDADHDITRFAFIGTFANIKDAARHHLDIADIADYMHTFADNDASLSKYIFSRLGIYI